MTNGQSPAFYSPFSYRLWAYDLTIDASCQLPLPKKRWRANFAILLHRSFAKPVKGSSRCFQRRAVSIPRCGEGRRAAARTARSLIEASTSKADGQENIYTSKADENLRSHMTTEASCTLLLIKARTPSSI